LIIDRTGATTIGYETIQLEVGLWLDMIVWAIRTLAIEWFAPILAFDIKSFKLRLIATK